MTNTIIVEQRPNDSVAHLQCIRIGFNYSPSHSASTCSSTIIECEYHILIIIFKDQEE